MKEHAFVGKDEQYFYSRRRKALRIYEELLSFGADPEKRLLALEVGCNHGFIAYHLAGMTSWEFSAGDLNKENLFRYPWVNERVELCVLDATKMPYKDGSFDIVVYNHVIEHIPEWEKTIGEIERVLRKGGLLYLATPNLHRKLVAPKVLLARKKGLDRKKRIDLHMGFSAVELRELLSSFSEVVCLNERHVKVNLPTLARPFVSILPSSIHERYAQTNVFIARK